MNSVDKSAEVILYGSRARGDERTDSDWDILILTDYPADLTTEQRFRDRLYYALFYAINALLVLNEIPTKSHSATKSQFSMHFIKTGRLDKRYGRLLSQLFDWRQKGDYENVFDYDQKVVEPLFSPVKEMIEKEINNAL